MFYVNGLPILNSEMEILETLRTHCNLAGLDILRVFKFSGKNIQTNCPFHKNGQERKPSFGINTDTMQCHCFSCGWSGDLCTAISNIFGYEDSGKFGRRWLSKNFLTFAIDDRKPLNITLSRTEKRIVNKPEGFTEEELSKYRYYHPYMYERGLTDKIIEDFDVGFDKDTQCLTFPCYDHMSNPVFIARRSVKTKFFNYPKETKKPVYASDKIMNGQYGECVICESILNALTCWKYNIPAVALIGTGTVEQYGILKMLPVRKYISALDPDEAGNKASQKLKSYLSAHKIITHYDIPKGKDLNDLQEQILILKQFF